MLNAVQRDPACRSWLLGAVALALGCLDPNPDFDRVGTTSDSSGDASGQGSDGDGDGTSEGVCIEDGYEPNDDAPREISLGSFALMLERTDAIDRYTLWREAGAPDRITASADAAVRVCAFVRCETDLEAAQIACAVGLSGGDENGNQGCCGGPAVDVTFTCGGDGSAKVYLVVDEAAADCTAYGLELGEV